LTANFKDIHVVIFVSGVISLIDVEENLLFESAIYDLVISQEKINKNVFRWLRIIKLCILINGIKMFGFILICTSFLSCEKLLDFF